MGVGVDVDHVGPPEGGGGLVLHTTLQLQVQYFDLVRGPGQVGPFGGVARQGVERRQEGHHHGS